MDQRLLDCFPDRAAILVDVAAARSESAVGHEGFHLREAERQIIDGDAPEREPPDARRVDDFIPIFRKNHLGHRGRMLSSVVFFR
jgi:hypothetical protein